MRRRSATHEARLRAVAEWKPPVGQAPACSDQLLLVRAASALRDTAELTSATVIAKIICADLRSYKSTGMPWSV